MSDERIGPRRYIACLRDHQTAKELDDLFGIGIVDSCLLTTPDAATPADRCDYCFYKYPHPSPDEPCGWPNAHVPLGESAASSYRLRRILSHHEHAMSPDRVAAIKLAIAIMDLENV